MRMTKMKQSENEVKKAIKKYLELNGWTVFRINNAGTKRKDKKGEFMIESEWKTRYVNRLIRHGLTKKESLDNCRAIDETDYTIEPESAADDEVSYMKGN